MEVRFLKGFNNEFKLTNIERNKAAIFKGYNTKDFIYGGLFKEFRIAEGIIRSLAMEYKEKNFSKAHAFLAIPLDPYFSF